MVTLTPHFSLVIFSSSSLPNRSPARRHAVRRTSPKPPSPSVLEVEKAIGAGLFEDQDSRSQRGASSFFDSLSSEGSAEKKLREAGEWIIDRTEGASGSGQEVLMVVGLRILPFWILSLLVASGVIKLPFSVPFLDNLLM
ncbi:probable NAD(P)H dehydrogenase subunit CRR3, chloroplastic [Aristolochia californica]|uniref:probable NAD(P)H dehydrogenase subunit CRR3, chloroplastic n=1 Tax=Aristolochia californica TaxID=171875 RepID=UPI0035E358A6